MKSTAILSFKNHAIFPKCDAHSRSGDLILQKFLYTHNPYCIVKQKRTCIKFKHSASCRHIVTTTPTHLIYSLIQKIHFDLSDMIHYIRRVGFQLRPLSIDDFHFLNNTIILINPDKIVPFDQTIEENTNSHCLDTSLTYLGHLLLELINIHPRKPTLPINTPLQMFIERTTHERLGGL